MDKFNPLTGKLDFDSGITDAPSDGLMYGRKDGAWVELSLIPPIDDWWDPTGGLPVAPADGVRYIADGSGSGWTDGYTYEWDATAGVWVEVIPWEGMMFWLIADLIFWVFFSGGWMEVGSGSFLKLDQTTPQYVDNGAPTFNEGIVATATGDTAITANKDIVLKAGQRLVFDG